MTHPWLHYTPTKGWMNDPNGLIHHQGRHHLFYQYNPAGTEFTNQHWGHASSPDLLTWTEHGIALGPSAESPYDPTACFSGCAVSHDGLVSILYTGVRDDKQRPCLAHAADEELTGFVKDPANPVVAEPPTADIADFRDHTVWRDEGQWHQLVAGAVPGVGASLFAYSADELRAWTYDGIFLDTRDCNVPGIIWECPDLFTQNGESALIISVIHDTDATGSDVWWLTGSATGNRFTVADTGVLDVGDRFYAPQSYWASNGRRIQFGWVRTHLDPAGLGGPSVGAMSLPRELSVRNGRLHSAPARELARLRVSTRTAPVGHATTLNPPSGAQTAGELTLDAHAAAAVRQVVLHSSKGTTMTVDLSALADHEGELRLFWDAGIVEVFRGGLAGTWTDLRLDDVAELHLHGDSTAQGQAEIWKLARPERLRTTRKPKRLGHWANR